MQIGVHIFPSTSQQRPGGVREVKEWCSVAGDKKPAVVVNAQLRERRRVRQAGAYQNQKLQLPQGC
jgi:hypothetical protein